MFLFFFLFCFSLVTLKCSCKVVPLNVYRNSKYKDFTENKHPFVIRIWV